MKTLTRLNRRSALQVLALTGLASSPLPALRAAESPTPPPPSTNPIWKTAVGLNGFESSGRKYRRTYPIWEVLHTVASLGFDGIELVDGWPQGPYPASSEIDRIKALRRLYSGFGLRIFSIQTSGADAFAPEASAREAWIGRFREWAALARALGCEHVGIWPGGGLRGQTLDAALGHCGRSFREAGRIAADHGLVAAFEIEPPFVFNRGEHMIRLLEIADHPALKTIYDPSHFDLMNGSTGRPHELLQKVGVPNIGYVHFTDTDGTLRDGGTSKHLAAGDGHARLETSLQLLREGGFRGWIMVDAWEIPDPYDAAAKAKRMLDHAARR